MNFKQIHLCFVGNMFGRNPKYITTQGQIVADLFAEKAMKYLRFIEDKSCGASFGNRSNLDKRKTKISMSCCLKFTAE